jgi:LysR family nitrogen assimilation transcriptional regulator
MVEFRQLRYLVAIVDAGSFSKASALLHIAQPALSQQMADLEADLGARLLERSVRGVTPTPAGQAVYRHAQTLLRLREQTRDVAHMAGTAVSGRVRLGLPSSLALILAAPLVSAMRARHPNVSLELHENPSAYLAAQLLDERVDLSLLVDEDQVNGLAIRPLLNERIFYAQAASRPAPTRRRSVELGTLAGQPMMLTTRATTLRRLIDGACAAAGITLDVQTEASSIQTLLTVVAEGQLCTLVPYSALSWHPATRNLRIWEVTPQVLRPASIAWSRSAPLTLAAETVRDTVGDVIAELVNSGAWRGAVLAA